MKVNVNKTKIMVFGFGKLRQNLKFTYKNVDIEIVKQFNHLGVIFTKTCNFDVTKKHQYQLDTYLAHHKPYSLE
jgi:hypothetical protein